MSDGPREQPITPESYRRTSKTHTRWENISRAEWPVLLSVDDKAKRASRSIHEYQRSLKRWFRKSKGFQKVGEVLNKALIATGPLMILAGPAITAGLYAKGIGTHVAPRQVMSPAVGSLIFFPLAGFLVTALALDRNPPLAREVNEFFKKLSKVRFSNRTKAIAIAIGLSTLGGVSQINTPEHPLPDTTPPLAPNGADIDLNSGRDPGAVLLEQLTAADPLDRTQIYYESFGSKLIENPEIVDALSDAYAFSAGLYNLRMEREAFQIIAILNRSVVPATVSSTTPLTPVSPER